MLINSFDETRQLWSRIADDIIQPKKKTYVPTGFINLDQGAFKLHRGDLVILAGRPAMGKTSLALSIACRSATKYRTGVVYYATNMPERTLAERMLRIQSSRIEQGVKDIDEHKVIRESAEILSDQRIALHNMPVFDMKRMESEVAGSDEVDLLIIDCLDGIKTASECLPSSDSVEQICKLKEFSKKSNLVIILLFNIGRGPENRTPHFPMITDLPEVETIIEYTDSIWLLYRERYYNRTCHDSRASLSLAYSKYAESVNTMLMFDEKSQCFHELFR